MMPSTRETSLPSPSTRERFSWLKLRLNALPQLHAEVAQVCAAYRKSPTETLYQDICLRIDELESFYLDNVDDARAVLVERVRIALEDTLQNTEFPGQNENLEQQEEEKEDAVEQVGVHHLSHSEHKQTAKKTKKNGSQVRKAKKTPIYAWEKNKKQEYKNINPVQEVDETVNASTGRTEKGLCDGLKPADAADKIASLSYAAAHSGELAFLSPFGKPFNFTKESLQADAEEALNPTLESETDTASGSEKTEIVANFEICISKEDYFEIMKRRQIYVAQQRGQKAVKAIMKKKRSMPANSQFYRSEQPYFDYREPHIRAVNHRNWVGEKDFR